MKGLVEAVDVIPVRGFLVADALAGATSLLVDDGDPFAIEGAQAVLAGAPHDVVSVVAGEGEDDPTTITLASPLAALLEAGEPVGVLPLVEYTTATVVLPGDLGVVEATVDQGLQGKVALQEGSYEGADRPRVDVELIDGEHFIVGVDGRGADDGSYIAPDTLPPSPPVQPVQPTSSPTPTVDGFAGLMLARWLGVLNETPVMYDVHVSASNAVAPSESTLVDSAASTMLDLRVLADGTPLAYDTTYYVAVVARSGDLAADPSPWVPGQMDRTRSADIAADAIDGMTITGATIRTASAGQRIQLDSEALKAFAPDGVTVTALLEAIAGALRLMGGLDVNAGGEINIYDANRDVDSRLTLSAGALELYYDGALLGEIKASPQGAAVQASVFDGMSGAVSLGAGSHTVVIGTDSAAAHFGVGAGAVFLGQSATEVLLGRLAAKVHVGDGASEIILGGFGSGHINVSEKRITSLATPTEASDAAPKGYVDNKTRAGRFTMPSYTGNNTMRVNFATPFPPGVVPAVTVTHDIGTGTNIARTAYAGLADNVGFTAVSVRAGGAADPAQPMQYTAIAP